MNQKLIKQVQEGTHCIEHTKKPEDLYRLCQIISECFPEDVLPDGEGTYYYKNRNRKYYWIWSNEIILTPIPLDDFFKEECGKCEMLSRMAGFPDKCDEHSGETEIVEKEISSLSVNEIIRLYEEQDAKISTPEEVLNDVAKFMGWRFIKWCGMEDEEKLPMYQRFEDDVLVHPGIFHEPFGNKDNLDWNSIMPVLEKIQSIDITPAPMYTGYRIEIVVQGYVMIKGFSMPTINTNVSVEGSLIAAVWKAVVQFIKWYNTQSK